MMIAGGGEAGTTVLLEEVWEPNESKEREM
jgi:hypothetical protein